MTLKSLFVPFFEMKSAETAFKAAMSLAARDKAHVSAVHVRHRPAPPAVVYFPLGGVSAEFTEDFHKAENDYATALKTRLAEMSDEAGAVVMALEARTDAHGATASWSDMEGDIPSDYARQATAHDLAVLAAAGDDSTPTEEMIAESLLFQSGRPVLLCPETGLPSELAKVAVAWNGSQEAARAVAAALGILKDAADMKVISVRKTSAPEINTAAITAYLRLHGVNAAATEIEVLNEESVNARLDAEVREEKPDLLVMGAYSHSRWRQAVLGGFTRHMIHEAKLPVLMMH